MNPLQTTYWERSAVSSRVALLLRSAEAKLLFYRFVQLRWTSLLLLFIWSHPELASAFDLWAMWVTPIDYIENTRCYILKRLDWSYNISFITKCNQNLTMYEWRVRHSWMYKSLSTDQLSGLLDGCVGSWALIHYKNAANWQGIAAVIVQHCSGRS